MIFHFKLKLKYLNLVEISQPQVEISQSRWDISSRVRLISTQLRYLNGFEINRIFPVLPPKSADFDVPNHKGSPPGGNRPFWSDWRCPGHLIWSTLRPKMQCKSSRHFWAQTRPRAFGRIFFDSSHLNAPLDTPNAVSKHITHFLQRVEISQNGWDISNLTYLDSDWDISSWLTYLKTGWDKSSLLR